MVVVILDPGDGAPDIPGFGGGNTCCQKSIAQPGCEEPKIFGCQVALPYHVFILDGCDVQLVGGCAGHYKFVLQGGETEIRMSGHKIGSHGRTELNDLLEGGEVGAVACFGAWHGKDFCGILRGREGIGCARER